VFDDASQKAAHSITAEERTQELRESNQDYLVGSGQGLQQFYMYKLKTASVY